MTSDNTIFTLRGIRPLVRPRSEVDSRMQSAEVGKRNQPDTSLHLTASRPPFGLKVQGRREYKERYRKYNANQIISRTLRSHSCNEVI